MKTPRLRKMIVTANPGNQPECMAESPTRIGATMAENVHHKTHTASFCMGISDQIPLMTARTTAPRAKRTIWAESVFFTDSGETVNFSSFAFSVIAAGFLCRKMITMAWTRDMAPAPIMTPCGIYVLPRSVTFSKPMLARIGPAQGAI